MESIYIYISKWTQMATQGPMGSYNFRRIRVVPEVVLPGWCAKLLCCFMLLYGWLT